MADDILAQYRRTPPASRAEAASGGKGDYAAFGTKDKVKRLRIRDAADSTHSPSYNILLNVSSDGDFGTNFVLVYTIMMVFVRGKNLQKLVFALEHDMAEYIQPFDAARWPAPGDDKAAVIESIEVKITGGAFADETERTTHGA